MTYSNRLLSKNAEDDKGFCRFCIASLRQNNTTKSCTIHTTTHKRSINKFIILANEFEATAYTHRCLRKYWGLLTVCRTPQSTVVPHFYSASLPKRLVSPCPLNDREIYSYTPTADYPQISNLHNTAPDSSLFFYKNLNSFLPRSLSQH
ncbi:hypothetical protein CFREI_08405 [Corynebacterium freiburgense]|nr:hypothetical protein CFREI_08405 [Corynebacterium freiburgense]